MSAISKYIRNVRRSEGAKAEDVMWTVKSSFVDCSSDSAVLPIIFSIKDYLGNTPISLDIFKNKSTNNLCIRTVTGTAWKTFDTGYNLGSDGLVLTNGEISGGRFVFADIETSFDGGLTIKTIKVNEQLYSLTLLDSGGNIVTGKQIGRAHV